MDAGTWLIAALIVLLAVALLGFVIIAWAGPDQAQHQRRRRTGEILVNTAIPLLVIFGLVVGIRSYENAPDASGCPAPDTQAAADAISVSKTQKSGLRTEVREKQVALRKAKREQQADPSPAATRKVERATAQRNRAVHQLGKWRGVKVSVEQTANTDLKFGHEFNSGTRAIRFAADKAVRGGRELLVEPVTLTLEGSGRVLDSEYFEAGALLDRDGTHGTISFCMIPTERDDVTAGKYSGAIVLPQGRVDRVEVPVTVTVAYAGYATPMLVALAVVFVSSWYVYFLRRPDMTRQDLTGPDDDDDDDDGGGGAAAGEQVVGQQLTDGQKAAVAKRDEKASKATYVLRWSFGFWQGYWRWVATALGAITIVAGAIGAITAFSTAYLASDTWSGDSAAWLSLIGAVATAFIAGGTAGKLAGMKFDKPLQVEAGRDNANG